MTGSRVTAKCVDATALNAMLAVMRPPFSILLEPEDAAMASRVQQLAEQCCRHALAICPTALMEGTPGRVLDAALRSVGAHEGSLWLATNVGTELLPVWNNGPDAQRFVGSFKLPSTQGITGLVFSTGLAACESEVCFHERQHRGLDDQLGVLTWAMLAVPLAFFGETRGVITAVRLVRRDALPVTPVSRAEWPADVPVPESFSVEHLAAMDQAGAVLSRLIEHRLQAWALGQDS